MTRLDRFSSIILVAVLAATAGWAASAFTSRHAQSDLTAPQALNMPAIPASNFQPVTAGTNSVTAFSPEPQNVLTSRSALSSSPVSAAPAEVATPVATRPRVVNPQARNESRTVSHSPSENDRYEPRVEQKRGMSKTMKNAIVIGGGAATGAVIGGIAGGKKGAAIGAIVGGGGGALYSWIRHKQHKPVF
ncbi:MAG: glycine zipper domain-containing protein [Blastocatellia bacterium]